MSESGPTEKFVLSTELVLRYGAGLSASAECPGGTGRETAAVCSLD